MFIRCPASGRSSTGFAAARLRPFLNLLDECEREQFVARYMEGLADAYPAEPDGRLLFLYPRLFVVAGKPGPGI